MLLASFWFRFQWDIFPGSLAQETFSSAFAIMAFSRAITELAGRFVPGVLGPQEPFAFAVAEGADGGPFADEALSRVFGVAPMAAQKAGVRVVARAGILFFYACGEHGHASAQRDEDDGSVF